MGIIKSAQVLSEALFKAGYDVKKAEVHGMSQRGGSVVSDVRFGSEILSPMIPHGEVDFLLALAEDEIEQHRPSLRENAAIINAAEFDPSLLPNRKTLNIAILGALSKDIDIPHQIWTDTITSSFPEKFSTANLAAFEAGRKMTEEKQ